MRVRPSPGSQEHRAKSGSRRTKPRRTANTAATPNAGRRLRSLAYVTVAIVCVLLGWRIIALTAAATLARTDPQAALAWQDDTPTALIALAEQRLMAADSDADLDAAGALAKQALSANPLAGRALRLLALVAELSGDPEPAERLMTLAGERSLRDWTVHGWLFNNRVRAADFAAALGHADAMLRVRPHIDAEVFPALARLAANTAARPALVAALASDPPWRSWFLRGLPDQSHPSVAFAVLSELRPGPHPPEARELRPYLDHLIETERFELAFLAWIHFLPPERLHNLPYVYNGDFEYPLSDLPFDWVVTAVDGATTEIVETGDSEMRRAVRITFANTRTLYRHLTKLLVLTPGAYRLSGSVMTNNLVNDRGLAWRLYCAEADEQLLGETAPVKGTMPWQAFQQEFEVPATGCRAQRLTLELTARIPIEQKVSGDIWFDRLAIRRAPTNALAATADETR